MWCKNCKKEVYSEICEYCGAGTEKEMPVEQYWCSNCEVPIIKKVNDPTKNICTLCGGKTKYMSQDLRPVFPEERLLFEILTNKVFQFKDDSVWANGSRYYIKNKSSMLSTSKYMNANVDEIIKELEEHRENNSYDRFNENIDRFIEANRERLDYLKAEAYKFIKETAEEYPNENIVVSFSGGKDSTAVAELVVNALGDPSLVHIFGDTTLEFPLTYEYANRFRDANPFAIFKTSKNRDQDFYEVCKDIGPPARMLRWCCTMFKTGPITRTINSMYPNEKILTFYGIRKHESVSRSKYNRVEGDSEAVKIQKQKVASPVFEWKDIDIWLYLLSEKIDFNDAYRLGYDRVGCWLCPNNSHRAQFLSKIYMPDRSKKWRDYLVEFAKSIGKPDAEVYVDTGKWKARQGGNGVKAAQDVKIKYTNCTSEEDSMIYELYKPFDETFLELMIPFGKVSKSMGRKLINETVVLDMKTHMPIISIQPFEQDEYNYSVKIKTMNVTNHEDLQRMIGYQVRKYNACRSCLKCESLCKYGAITIHGGEYHISDKKCVRCKMCVTAKYLDGGCLMKKFMFTKDN
ncbi:phosphoadenosine phosphosulfate reductase domain-containing protein [Fusibacter tunisiensis]|uniref:Phosphoadenosine phosphosulfate reductase n=1 Tax=Fusibacter tunisiensis TaxID=1008308 RepID=A0ABS2MTC6_9FIRM|nr:phosphoadenosine phosphosulfate reductase family protein [Fusibacter tunisiensis]MBM7562610.1 phosphoadenosine phosphosulfate reductase [Fusibacter tunisiensis]